MSRRRRTQQEAFIARNEGRTNETRETDASGVTTEHNRPGTIIMYKPTETQGYVARRVSVSAIRILLGQGWSELCPDCGDEHLNRDGVATTDPNACKARPPTAFAICPVCRHSDDRTWRKRIYDNQSPTANDDSDEEDSNPNLIRFNSTTTPEQRVEALYNLHMWTLHPRWSQMKGLAPLPAAMREIAESRQASIS